MEEKNEIPALDALTRMRMRIKILHFASLFRSYNIGNVDEFD